MMNAVMRYVGNFGDAVRFYEQHLDVLLSHSHGQFYMMNALESQVAAIVYGGADELAAFKR